MQFHAGSSSIVYTHPCANSSNILALCATLTFFHNCVTLTSLRLADAMDYFFTNFGVDSSNIFLLECRSPMQLGYSKCMITRNFYNMQSCKHSYNKHAHTYFILLTSTSSMVIVINLSRIRATF